MLAQARKQQRLLWRAGLAAALCVLASATLLLQRGLPLRCPAATAGVAGLLGGGTAPSAGDVAGDAACDLPVAASPWAADCQLFRDVCVDQGTLILYGHEHRMTDTQPGTAPYELKPDPEYGRYIFIHRNDSGRDYRYSNPPLRVRPASDQEGAAYLAQPVFSSCTVPVLWYPLWLANVAHFFRDNAAKLYSYVQQSPWAADHLKLVIVTAEGHAAPAMNFDITQPLLRQRIETWADFGARLPSAQARDGSGYVPAQWLPPSPSAALPAPLLSFEGGPARCFRQLLVCHRGLNTSSWLWPFHGLGQRLAQHYGAAAAAAAAAAGGQQQRQQPPPQQLEQQEAVTQPQAAGMEAVAAAAAANAAAEAAALAAQKAAASTAEAGLPAADGGGKEELLRVVFHKRSTPDRQLLNAGELIEACNSWRHTTPDGRRLRAVCWQFEPADVFGGIAAAQAADVFVGVHGANMANAWLLRPGSSMIELSPFGFDEHVPSLQYPLFNYADPASRVLWWVIAVCDAQFSEPGQEERRGEGSPTFWAKNRNIRLPWHALEHALQTAVDMGGDAAAYRRRMWKQGRWMWWLGSGGSLAEVGKESYGNGRFQRKRCPAASQGADHGA